MIALLLGVICLVLYWVFRRHDRRMLRHGVLLLSGLVLLAAFAVDSVWQLVERIPEVHDTLGHTSGVVVAFLLLLLTAPIGFLALISFLLINGVTMLRREGHSLANMLSLLAGVVLLAAPGIFVWLFLSDTAVGVSLAVLMVFGLVYISVCFVVVLVYAFAYSRASARVVPVAVVILGAQIIEGQVPPLLQSRLDRAVTLYQGMVAEGHPPPLMIPSGGQGPDESRPEGEAMAEYLMGRGIPADDIASEERAVNTEQNLLYSAAIQRTAGRPGPVVAVTNSYHALRTALLARRLRLDAEAVGARTAFYYVPSAFLREFMAVMIGHRVLHAVLFTPLLLVTAGVFILWLLA